MNGRFFMICFAKDLLICAYYASTVVRWLRLSCDNSSISQLQLQRLVHCSPAFLQLQLIQPLPDLQLYLMTSVHALAASGIVIQMGIQLVSASSIHPQQQETG